MASGEALCDLTLPRLKSRYWRDPGLFAGEDAVSRLQGIWSGVTWGAFAVVSGLGVTALICS